MDLNKLLHDLMPLIQILSYSGVLCVAIYALFRWHENVRKTQSKSEPTSAVASILDFLLVGIPVDKKDAGAKDNKNADEKGKDKTSFERLGSIAISFFGLQASYLTWGWIQERIMTNTYGESHERFPSSNVLVLSNRVFAIIFSYIVVQYIQSSKGGLRKAPFMAFAFPSIANTLSSFAAYESLRFMSFPMSTVCKTLKIIPTMVVGTFVQRKIYTPREYASALIITLGAALFAAEYGAGGLDKLLTSEHGAGGIDMLSLTSAIPGVILMAAYLLVDAFTSNLQSYLFQEYKLTSYECMLGINAFSIWLSLFNLIQAGELWPSINFLSRYPNTIADLTLLALSSALGQLFIYYTIERHGPLIFAIIQLSRQLLAILLSSWSFGHVVNAKAWAGILMVFSGILAMNGSKAKPKPKSS